MNTRVMEFGVRAEEEGSRLLHFLRGRGVSLSVVRSLKAMEGGILLNGGQGRTNMTLHRGDVVSLHMCDEGFSVRPQQLPLKFIYQSADALVVDKPAGMAVHPGPSHHGGTLANAVCGLYESRGMEGLFRPVGRLDVNTSGLVLCAGNPASAALLTHSFEKIYLALAGGEMKPGDGVMDAPLGPVKGSAVKQHVTPAGRGSRTKYRVLASGGGVSLVAVRPLTGRTHQIRAHFAHLGHPLLGDALYGGSLAVLGRHALHCAAVRFEELSGNRPCLSCPMPEDMKAAAKMAGLPAGVGPADVAALFEGEASCKTAGKIV